MSRSNYDKPFYVDVGTSIAAIRCSSDGDIVDSLDHNGSEYAIKIVERTCDRMNREVELYAKLKAESTQPKSEWSVKDALAFANTLANYGWTQEANADAASACIYALCRMFNDGVDASAKQNKEPSTSQAREEGDSGIPNVSKKDNEDIISQSESVGNTAAMRAVLVNIATEMIGLIETPKNRHARFQPQAVLDEIKQVIPELEGV
jgi:hypothetical protein